MSSVTIGNLALSFLGDEATVATLDPPEGSDQAEHIAQFYPFARDSLLEMHPWPFATKRGALTLRDETINGWEYSYDRPDGTECLKIFAVIPPNAPDDYSLGYEYGSDIRYTDAGIVSQPRPSGFTTYIPVKFASESASNGDQIILTNQPDAHARWVKRVTDTTKFSPLFRIGCAKLLASFIAGPIYKGETGVKMSNLMMQHFQMFFNQSIVLGAGDEGMEDVQQSVPHLAGR